MRLLMLGAPGSGKGTQAKRLAAHFGVAHLATGDLLRAEVAAGSELGMQVRDVMAKGDLVGDDIIEPLMHDHLLAASQAGGYVLDGFPRTIHQATAAYEFASEAGATVHAVIYLHVPEDELLRRMLARGEDRHDDSEATIRHRLEVFHERTEPLVEYYEGRGVLEQIDGCQSPDAVFDEILARISAREPSS
jgi:adenylate kinase